MTAEEMFQFCKQNIKGITYMYVRNEEVVNHGEELKQRFENCQRLPGTRKFHRYVPISEKTVRCYITYKSVEYEDYSIMKPVTLSYKEQFQNHPSPN